MGDRYLTDLADVCRAVGLPVIEEAGWQTRARGSGGYDGDRPWCVMWHHTASDTSPANDVNYIIHGCPDAPVANLYLSREGVVHVCAGGATNTNGKGGPLTLTRGTVPLDSMNTHAIGIEAANNGVGQPWPQVQIDAYFALSNALTAAYGLAPYDLATHAEWAPSRKIDPATAAAVQGPWGPGDINSSGTWNVDDVRFEATDRSTPPTPNPPGGTDVQNYYIVTGANARFIGTPAQVFWTGPGTDKALAAINTQLEAGNLQIVDLTGGPNAFGSTFLAGPVPVGDTLHTWTGAEFAGLLGY